MNSITLNRLENERKNLADGENSFKSVQLENDSKDKELEEVNKQLLVVETTHAKEMEAFTLLKHKKEETHLNFVNMKANLVAAANKRSKNEQDMKEKRESMDELLKQHQWITQEEQFFGQIDSGFDFGSFNYKDMQEHLEKLIDVNKVLKRKVNMKVDSLLGEYEKQYDELIKKRNMMIKDKSNIEKVIITLDNERVKELKEVFVEVNDNFNNIFSTLLPGTSAKLSYHDEGDLMEGLEMRVAFNNNWKESLIELSGGQKSLLALSLILALLKYKPAPLYILDEIDAALDISHTQNLGIMIKKYFPQSQFIIVSLKDGMFSNANVLFKVHFQDGTSNIIRKTNKKSIKI